MTHQLDSPSDWLSCADQNLLDFILKKSLSHTAKPGLENILTFLLINQVGGYCRYFHHFYSDISGASDGDGLYTGNGLSFSAILRGLWEVREYSSLARN